VNTQFVVIIYAFSDFEFSLLT